MKSISFDSILHFALDFKSYHFACHFGLEKSHKFHSETLFLPWSSGKWFCCFCLPSGKTFGKEAVSCLSRHCLAKGHTYQKRNGATECNCQVVGSGNRGCFFRVAILLFKGHFVWPRGKVKISPKKWISQLVFGALRITLKKFVEEIGVYNNLKFATALFAALKYATARPKEFSPLKKLLELKRYKTRSSWKHTFFSGTLSLVNSGPEKKVGQQTSWNIMAIYLLIFHLFWGR